MFKIDSKYNFNQKAIEIFNYQYNNNSVYSKYCKLINVDVKSIKKIEDIPFLPIQFFKNNIVSSHREHTHLFKSSGTWFRTYLEDGREFKGNFSLVRGN